MVVRKLLIAIKILAVVGIGISGYALAHHDSFVSGSFCAIGASFDCDTVNRGAFSEMLGIPVALFGVIGYLFLGITAFAALRLPHDRSLPKLLVAEAALGLLFTLYLTGIEAFVIRSFCIICLSSQVVMLGIFSCTIALFRFQSRGPTNGS